MALVARKWTQVARNMATQVARKLTQVAGINIGKRLPRLTRAVTSRRREQHDSNTLDRSDRVGGYIHSIHRIHTQHTSIMHIRT